MGVEDPILQEVAVADEGTEGEYGFCAGDAPSAAGDVEAVGHQMACGSFDDAAGDGPAGCEGLVVVHEGGVVLRVAAGLVDRDALSVGEMADERLKSFRLLIAVLAVADERRR